MGSRPELLYLSPVVPAFTGNGLAMRAATVLRVLADTHAVSLLVVRLYAPYRTPVPPEVGRLCSRLAVVPGPAATSTQARLRRRLRQALSPSPAPVVTNLAEEAALAFAPVGFDVVHVFRLAMVPFARPYADGLPHRPRRARRDLDLDDVESVSRRRIAELYRMKGDAEAAACEEAAAAEAERQEANATLEFDRIYVCSEGDRERLLAPAAAQVCVLPNAVPAVESPSSKPREGAFTLLFVGTLGYYPNEDALVYFCTQVLPLLRRSTPLPFRVVIVGTGAPPAVEQLSRLPEITLVGHVPDVAPWYREADAVIVPVRAGGGTRIKVLEAFSHRRPVVTTSIGIEGITARSGKHVLVGDTPAELADRCRMLMCDPGLAERLAAAAFSLFQASYSLDAMARTLAACSSSPPPPQGG